MTHHCLVPLRISLNYGADVALKIYSTSEQNLTIVNNTWCLRCLWQGAIASRSGNHPTRLMRCVITSHTTTNLAWSQHECRTPRPDLPVRSTLKGLPGQEQDIRTKQFVLSVPFKPSNCVTRNRNA